MAKGWPSWIWSHWSIVNRWRIGLLKTLTRMLFFQMLFNLKGGLRTQSRIFQDKKITTSSKSRWIPDPTLILTSSSSVKSQRQAARYQKSTPLCMEASTLGFGCYESISTPWISANCIPYRFTTGSAWPSSSSTPRSISSSKTRRSCKSS